MIGATYLASGNWNPICLPHLPACGQEIHYPFYFSLSPSSPLKHGARKIDKRNRLLLSRRWSRRSKSKLVHSYDDFALKFIVEIILSNTIDRYELFEEKNYFLPDFTIGGERETEKIKTSEEISSFVKDWKSGGHRQDVSHKGEWQETDYKKLSCDARQLMNAGRVRDDAHSLHAYARCRIIIH